MVLCPIALAVGCKRCPAFSVCPLKTVIGDADKTKSDAAPNPVPPRKETSHNSRPAKRAKKHRRR